MNYLVEMAVSAFFLVCASAVGFMFFSRVRGLERQLALLLRSALANMRDVRHCAAEVERGFAQMRRADDQHRVMLASLSGQMGELNRMLMAAPPAAAELPSAPLRAANAAAFSQMEDEIGDAFRGGLAHAALASQMAAMPDRMVASPRREAAAGSGALPGYRTVARGGTQETRVENGAEASRQRKIRRIEELFRRVGADAPVAVPAPVAHAYEEPADEAPAAARRAVNVAAFPAPSSVLSSRPSARGQAPAGRESRDGQAARLAEMISQRRRIVNG